MKAAKATEALLARTAASLAGIRSDYERKQKEVRHACQPLPAPADPRSQGACSACIRRLWKPQAEAQRQHPLFKKTPRGCTCAQQVKGGTRRWSAVTEWA